MILSQSLSKVAKELFPVWDSRVLALEGAEGAAMESELPTAEDAPLALGFGSVS